MIRHAWYRGCFLELDSEPDRLDVLDLRCPVAQDEGVIVAVASEAHSVPDLVDLELAIGQARRGWPSTADVPNAGDLVHLRP